MDAKQYTFATPDNASDSIRSGFRLNGPLKFSDKPEDTASKPIVFLHGPVWYTYHFEPWTWAIYVQVFDERRSDQWTL